MKISNDKTKVLAFEGKDTKRFKIVVNKIKIEQILNFNYVLII